MGLLKYLCNYGFAWRPKGLLECPRCQQSAKVSLSFKGYGYGGYGILNRMIDDEMKQAFDSGVDWDVVCKSCGAEIVNRFTFWEKFGAGAITCVFVFFILSAFLFIISTSEKFIHAWLLLVALIGTVFLGLTTMRIVNTHYYLSKVRKYLNCAMAEDQNNKG